jgi:hypothetical protein
VNNTIKRVDKFDSDWHGGRKPNGQTTYSERAYFDAWNKTNRAIERKLGVKVFGFDPCISVYDAGDVTMTRTCELPLWIVRRILDD